jgi:DNA-binding GntR family transcriptional regulator
MSSRAAHNKECMEKLGESFDHINAWLDGMASQKNFEGVDCLDINHRVHRHHKEAVEHIREEYGDKAAEAAELHIKRDMGEVLSHEDMIRIYGTTQRLVPWEDVFGVPHNEDS